MIKNLKFKLVKTYILTKQYLFFFLLLIVLGQFCHAANQKYPSATSTQTTKAEGTYTSQTATLEKGATLNVLANLSSEVENTNNLQSQPAQSYPKQEEMQEGLQTNKQSFAPQPDSYSEVQDESDAPKATKDKAMNPSNIISVGIESEKATGQKANYGNSISTALVVDNTTPKIQATPTTNQQKECACARKGHYYGYFKDDSNYHCTVCGDFKIPFQNIFTRENCWQAFLSTRQTWKVGEIKRFMDRIDLESIPITDTDFSNLGLNDALLERIVRTRFQQAPDALNILDFSNNQISNITSLVSALNSSSLISLNLSRNKIRNITSLAGALPSSSLRHLDLSRNKIRNITSLAGALPSSSLRHLDLSRNKIRNITSLAGALPSSSLRHLDLSSNNIMKLTALAKTLPYTHLNSLYASYQTYGGKPSIMLPQFPISDLTYLDFNGQWYLNDIITFVSATPYFLISRLYLNGNQISNLTTTSLISNPLPTPSLYFSYNSTSNLIALSKRWGFSFTYVKLHRDQISNLIALARQIPFSFFTYLNLTNNNIRDITPFANSLPSSQLIYLDFSWNISNMTDIPPLPSSQLIGFDLFSYNISNMTDIPPLPLSQLIGFDLFSYNISNMTGTASVLPYLDLTPLYLHGNQITPFASVLPSSNITCLDFSWSNMTGIASVLPYLDLTPLYWRGNQITPFESVLPSPKLTCLDFYWNNVSNGIACVLPYLDLTPLYLRGNQITPFESVLPSSKLICPDFSLLLYDQLLYTSFKKYWGSRRMMDHIDTDVSNLLLNDELLDRLPDNNLTPLALSGGQITDITPLSALNISLLTSLDLSSNNLTSLARALSNTNLTSLTLSGGHITDRIYPVSILPSSKLICPDFSLLLYDQLLYTFFKKYWDYRRMMDHIDTDVSNLLLNDELLDRLPDNNLTPLALSGGQITDITPLSALNISLLTSLDLSSNNLTALARALSNTNLTSLTLSGGHITDRIYPVSVLPSSKLTCLDLSLQLYDQLLYTSFEKYWDYHRTMDHIDTDVNNLLLNDEPFDRLLRSFLSSNISSLAVFGSQTTDHTALISNNPIRNISPLSNAIVCKEETDDHAWFIRRIFDVFSDTQDTSAMFTNNCPSLTYLYLSNNTIETADAINFCRTLAATNVHGFSLVDNEGIKGIDTNVIDPYTCRVSAAPRDSVTATFALVGALVAYWLR